MKNYKALMCDLSMVLFGEIDPEFVGKMLKSNITTYPQFLKAFDQYGEFATQGDKWKDNMKVAQRAAIWFKENNFLLAMVD